MLLSHQRTASLAVLLALSFATAANAVVLWDQSPVNVQFDGSVNLVSSSCNQISGNTKVHTASDVHFGNPVVLTSVRIYETPGNVQAATQAYLWIAPKTGPIPTAASTDIEVAANLVTITSTALPGGQVIEVSANGLSRSLPAGDYWVSLTPRHSLGIFPYSVHLYTTAGSVVGDPTAAIVACTVNSNWIYPLTPNKPDYTLKLEGTVPVPAMKSSWGRVKSIYR